MADLYLQEIPLNAETESYLKAIPSREDASEKEIREKKQLFFEKVAEGLKKEYPFLDFNLFKVRLDGERVYIVFQSDWSHNETEAVNKLFHLNFDNNEDFREYCQRQFEKKFGQELKEVVKLKNRINDLEKKLKEEEEKLKSYKGDFDYTQIKYKNLNDLNSAKFLSDDEKRLICGLLPKSK